MTITVNAVNDAPVANDDTNRLDEDTPLNFPASDLVSNDNEGAANESAQNLTVTEVFDGTHGTVASTRTATSPSRPRPTSTVGDLHLQGSRQRQPEQCSNGNGQRHRQPGQRRSGGRTTQYTTDEDTANDRHPRRRHDVDGDSLTTVLVTGPAHGTLSLERQRRTYTPAANYNGPDSFTYKANDGTDDSNVATVTITVTSVNDTPGRRRPVGHDRRGHGQSITLSGSDVDGDTLTYAIVTGPTNGTLSGTAANRHLHPDPNYNGSDSFTYKANDGNRRHQHRPR